MDHKPCLLPSLPTVALQAMVGFVYFFTCTLLIFTVKESQALELKKPLFQKIYSTYHGTSYEDTLQHTFETATNRKNYWVLSGCQGFGYVQPITEPYWYQTRYCRDFHKVTQNYYGATNTSFMRFCQDKGGKWQQVCCIPAPCLPSCTLLPTPAKKKRCYDNKTRQ